MLLPLKYGRGLGPGVQVQVGQADGGDQCYGWAGAGVYHRIDQHLAIQDK